MLDEFIADGGGALAVETVRVEANGRRGGGVIVEGRDVAAVGADVDIKLDIGRKFLARETFEGPAQEGGISSKSNDRGNASGHGRRLLYREHIAAKAFCHGGRVGGVERAECAGLEACTTRRQVMRAALQSAG